MTFGIIVKQYEHFNRSFGNWDTPKGKYISSRAHYEKELAKGGYVTFKEGEKLASDAQRKNYKPYDGLTKEAMEVINSAKMSASKKGVVKWSGKLIDGMKKTGVAFDTQWCPAHYAPKGGFTDGE